MTVAARRLQALMLTLAAPAVLILLAAPSAAARDAHMRSFDGTRILLHFFPAAGLEPTTARRPS